jgi:hypothetical protein
MKHPSIHLLWENAAVSEYIRKFVYQSGINGAKMGYGLSLSCGIGPHTILKYYTTAKISVQR